MLIAHAKFERSVSDPESPTPVNGAVYPLEILPGYCSHSAKLSSCTSNWETALRKETRTRGRKTNQTNTWAGVLCFIQQILIFTPSVL